MKQSKVNEGDSERFLLGDQSGEVRLLVLYHPMGLTSWLYNHRVSLPFSSVVAEQGPQEVTDFSLLSLSSPRRAGGQKM